MLLFNTLCPGGYELGEFDHKILFGSAGDAKVAVSRKLSGCTMHSDTFGTVTIKNWLYLWGNTWI